MHIMAHEAESEVKALEKNVLLGRTEYDHSEHPQNLCIIIFRSYFSSYHPDPVSIELRTI